MGISSFDYLFLSFLKQRITTLTEMKFAGGGGPGRHSAGRVLGWCARSLASIPKTPLHGCLPVILAQGEPRGPVVKVIPEVSLGYGRPCLEQKEVGGEGREE